MNLQKFMKKHNLTRNQVIEVVQMNDPKFSKVVLSMALNPLYGVQLSAGAVRALKEEFEPESLEPKPKKKKESVIHCKDCKHWVADCYGCTDNVKRCEWADWMVGKNGFCVYGEKRGAE